MKKITKEKDDIGQPIIYVAKCDRFEYEDQRTPIKGLCQLDFDALEIDDIIRIKRELSKRDRGREIQ